MRSFRFKVSLRFASKFFDPTEIISQLGWEPKWQHKMGEQRKTPNGISLDGFYESSYCTFNLMRRNEEELHEMLNRIADELLPHKDFLCRIREKGGRIEFFIGWFSTGNTGEVLSYNLLKKLGELNIDLSLDVYGD